MADQAQLELIISAQADRVLAGLSSFERSLNAIEKAHQTTGAAAAEHSSKVEAFIGKMTRLADVGKLFAAWEVIERVMGAFTGLEQFNTDMLRMTEILGGNAQAASTWLVIAKEMGLEATNIERGFAALEKQMNSGNSAALKQMGIASEDTKGHLRDLNSVLNDAADYFQAHAGAANNATLANDLFGRSGYQLLPVLEQGRAGIAAITEEARKYGLILDAETVQRNAAFTFQLKEAQLAAEGLEVSVGNALLPGIAALGQAFSRVISDNLPAFIAGINRAVSYVIGFAEALTGMELKVGEGALALSSLAGISGDTGTALDSTAGAAQALADAEQKVRDQAKDATAAIDDQIRALNAQTAAAHFADQQAKLQQDLANKAKDITDLQHQQYQQFWLGNFQTAADVGEKITAAQQQQGDIQKQLAAGVNDEQTKQKIAALEDQKRSMQDAANDQVAAMQRAAKATTAAMAGAASSLPPLFSQAGKDAANNLKFALDSSAEGIGKSMGSKLLDALFGPEVTVTFEGHGTRQIEKTFRQGGFDFVKVGGTIGDAIGTGIITAMGTKVANYWKNVEAGIQAAAGANPSIAAVARIFEPGQYIMHTGGVVPGSRGSDVPIMAQAGERVLSANQNDDIIAVLQQMVRLQSATLAAVTAGGGAAGVQAALYNAIDQSKRMRGRGVVGATA